MSWLAFVGPRLRGCLSFGAHLIASSVFRCPYQRRVFICRRIEVHNPQRMEKEVLGRYFRHSKVSCRVSSQWFDRAELMSSSNSILHHV